MTEFSKHYIFSALSALNSFTYGILSLMVKIRYVLLVTLSIPTFLFGQLNGNYTIGPSGNYTTFAAAVAAINGSGVNGPVVFDVMPGVYYGNIAINQITGANATNTITFRSQNNDSTSVVLNGTNTNPVVYLNGADYIRFSRITFHTNNTAYSCFSIQNTAIFNIIENCVTIGYSINSTSTLYANIQSTGTTTNDQGNIFRNNVIQNGSHGIYWNGWATTPYESGLVIEGNRITDVYQYGLYVFYTNASQIRNNYINNSNSVYNTAFGTYINYANNNFIFTHNTIISKYMGLRVGYSGMNSTFRGLVANNFVTLSHPNGTTLYGLYTNNNQFTDFVHNSVNTYNNSTTSTSYTWYESASANCNFLNNIFSNEGLPGSNNYSAYIATNTGGRVIDYNNYWNISGSNNFAYHPSYGTFSYINRGLFINGLYGGSNSVQVDPMFVSTFDLHHYNSQLNVGTNLISLVPNDIDNQTRVMPVTIGADQYTLTPNDAGVITMQNLPTCPGTQPVVIKIRNYGTQTLTSATINWSVNSIPQTPFNWTGTISPLDSSSNITIGNFNFIAGNNYSVYLATTNPNGNTDPNPSNDAIIRNASPALSGTYTIGATGNYLNFTSAVSALVSRGVCSPVVFRVQNGIYTENLNIPTITGASSINTITFESFNNDSSLVTLNGTGSIATIILNGADYFRFKKLSITTSTYRVFEITNSAVGNTIENCYLQGYNFTSTSNVYSVIYSVATAFQDSSNTIRNNRIRYGSYGIYWNGFTTGTFEPGLIIDNNQVLDSYYGGIYITYHQAPIISNNIIDQHSVNYATCRGIWMQYCNGATRIERNQIRSRQYGLYFGNSIASSNSRSLISNNFISLMGFTATTLYGLYDISNQFADYYHNSVSTQNVNTTSTHYTMFTNNSFHNRFINNIFNNNGPAGTANYSAYITAGSGTAFDHNAYWVIAGSSNLAYHNTTGNVSPVNFNQLFRSVSAGGLNSRNVNPQFISISNLRHSTNSLNFGLDLTSHILQDIDHQTRTPFVTVGAFEFEPGPNDAGISAILTSPPCQGFSAFQVSLTNYGTSPLTNVSINWTINSVPQATFAWTGNLAPGATSSPITIGSYNFVPALYTYQVFTSNPNGQTDNDSSNDLASGSGNPAMGGVYSIGPTGNYLTFNAAVSAMQSAGLCSPIIFRIQNGTYNENVIIPQVNGSSSINTITFESLNNDSSLVTLFGTGTGPVLNFNGADYVTFRAITVQTNTGRCIDFTNTASFNTIERCRLLGQITSSTANTQSVVYSASTGTFDNYNTIRRNHIQNGSYGVYWNGRTAAPYEAGMLIDSNVIVNPYAYGLFLGYMSSPVVSNNVVSNNTTGNVSSYGMYFNYCYDSLRIFNNHITTSRYGLYYNYCIGNANLRGRIYNNFVYTIHPTGSTIYGMYGNYSQFQDIIHNSVYTQNPGTGASYTLYEGYSSNIQYLNNNFHNGGPARANNYAAYILNNPNKFFDYNNYYVPMGSTHLAYHNLYGNFTVNNWSLFNTATYGGLNSISIQSNYLSNSNLRHSNHLLNVGVDLRHLSSADIDGSTRTLPVTIGAYEFDQRTLDVGVNSFVNNPPCLGISTVQVHIQNYGLDTLTSAIIHWAVNNVPQTPFTWSGSLVSTAVSSAISLGTFNFISGNTYTVIAYTQNPNGQQDMLVVNDSSSMTATPALGGVFTIGSGGDYGNFTAAVNDLVQKGICGPVVFRAFNGVYTESLSIPQITGASNINTITFESFNQDSTLVILQSATTNVVWMNGADYVTFRKITLQNTGTVGRVFEFSNSSNYNRIMNCVLNGSVSNTNTTAYAVIFSSATGTFDDFNEIRNNVINDGTYGIYWYGRATAPYEQGFVVDNNQFNRNSIRGIDLQYMNAPVVTRNKIYNTSGTYALTYGMYLSYCYNNTLVEQNEIHAKGYGLYLNYLQGNSLLPAMIHNNFITAIPVTGQLASAFGLYVNYGTYMNVLHNTVNVENMHVTSGYAAYAYYDMSPTYVTNRNNIFRQFSPTSTSTAVISAYLRGSTGTTYDYNVYYTNPSNTNIAYHINWGTFNNSQWATFLNASYGGGNSLNVNPNFVSQTNLHVFSQALNAGQNLIFQVSDDIDGQSRVVPITIGADQYTPTANDAGVNAIVSFLPACQGVSNVVVNIRNYGTSTLTSASIEWSVNNIPQIPFSWTGNLAVGGLSGNITIGTYNFAPGLPHTVIARTRNPNGLTDGDSINDLTSITSAGPLVGNYTIGFTGTFLSFNQAVTALINQGVCGPVVFQVESGVYSENLNIPQITGSSAINTIVFESQNNDSTSVILVGSGSSPTVFMNGADYVTWRLLTIRTQLYQCFQFSNTSTNNTIENCVLFGYTISSTSNLYSVIYSNATGTSDANMTIRNNIIQSGSYGVYWNGWTSSPYEPGFVLDNNNIHSQYYMGIYLRYLNAPIITRNVIDLQNTVYTTPIAAYIYNNYNNILVSQNDFKSRYFALQYGNNVGTTVLRGSVFNNFISVVHPTGGTIYGMYTISNQYQNYFHNSVNTTNTTATTHRTLFCSNDSYSSYRNNIFQNNGPGGTTTYAAYISAGTGTTFDYNNYFVTGGTNIAYHNSFGNFTIGNWNTFRQTAYGGLNSINVNSNFFSNTDLHHVTTALNFGIDLTATVSQDIDGVVRTVPVTMGATEYNAAAHDAGAHSIIPAYPCPGSQLVEARIRNWGTNNLTSATIQWSVNNVPQTPVSWTGNLSSGSVSAPIALGNFTFVSGTNYSIVISTQNPNGQTDANPINDSFSYIGGTQLSGVYTIGNTGNYPSFTASVNALVQYGVCGPVVFRVQNGTYSENISIPQIQGASNINTIRYESFNNDSTLVTLSGSGNVSTLILNGSDYFTFRRIGFSTAQYRCIDFMNGANDNVIENCLLQGYNINSTSTNFSVIFSSSSVIADNNDTIRNNVFSRGSYGVYWNGFTSAPYESGFVLEGNNIQSPYYMGVYLRYFNSPVIKDNIIDMMQTPYTIPYGLYMQFCYNNVEVSYNDIRSKYYGFYFANNSATSLLRAKCFNNFVSCIRPTAGIAYGMYNLSNQYWDYYHNSVNSFSGNGTSTHRTLFSSNESFTTYRNNIFNNLGPAGTAGYSVYVAPGSGISFDYNNYYVIPGNTYLAYYNTNYTPAQWNTFQANNLGGINSINIDPQFVSQTDLHHSNNGLNLGLDLRTEVPDDIDNQNRTLVVTIGADEFKPGPPAPTAILAGSNPICSGSGTHLTAVGPVGTVYWYTGSCGGTQVATGNIYTITPSVNTTYYARNFDGTQFSSTCATINITVDPAVGSNVIGSQQTLCSGQVPSGLTGSNPSGGNGTYAYTWLESTDNTTWLPISGATQSFYAPGTLIQNVYYRRVVQSGACQPNSSQSISIGVIPVVTPSVSISANPGTTVCQNAPVIFNSNPVNAGPSPVWQWQLNGNPIGPNASTFNTSSLVNGDVVSLTMTSNAVCASPTSVISNSLTITVNPSPSAPALHNNTPICTGSTFNMSVTPVPFASYSWQGPNGFTSSNVIINIPNATSSINGVYTVTINVLGCPSNPGVTTVSVQDSIGIQSIAADQTICAGNTPSILSGVNPTGGSGIYTYQWEESPDLNSWSSLPGETQIDYTSGSMLTTQYYRRIVSSGVCPASSSSPLRITVEPLPGNNSISSNQTVCQNTVPALIAGSIPSGGDGSYQYSWQSATNPGSWVNISGETLSDYQSGLLSGSTYFRRIVQSGVCNADSSLSLYVEIDPVIVNNQITTAQTLCSGTVPLPLNGSIPGGGTGTFQYQWEESNDNVNWTPISGASLIGYNPGVILTTTYIRRGVYSGACTDMNATLVIVAEPAIGSNQVSSSQTLCSGSNAATLTGSVPSGGIGVYSFAWESSLDLSSWNTLSGVVSVDYMPGVINASVYYRRIVQSGVCPMDTSVHILITADQPVSGNTLGGNQTLCINQTSPILTGQTPSGGNGIYTYVWESSSDANTWLSIPGETQAQYVANGLISNTYFRRIVSSGACGASSSMGITVFVLPQLSGSMIGNDQTICIGSFINGLTGQTPTGGNGSYTYQWESSADNSVFASIPGAVSPGLNPGSYTATTYLRRQVYSSVCNITSAGITIRVDSLIGNNMIGNAQSICAGFVPALMTGSLPTGGSGNYTYTWESSSDQLNWSNLAGASTMDYQSGVLNSTTYFRRWVGGSVCAQQVTFVNPVNVVPIPSANLSGDHTICAGSNALLSIQVSGGGPFSVDWTDGVSNFTQTGINTSPYLLPVSPAAHTTYALTGVSTSCSGTATGSSMVDVRPVPTATLAGSNTLCTGSSTQLTFQLTGVGPWDINYSAGTQTIQVTGITQSPYLVQVTPASTTTYSLNSVFATCSGLVSGTVVVVVNPIPSAMLSGNQTICSGSASALTVQLTGTAPWDITIDDGNSPIVLNGILSSPYIYTPSPVSHTTYSLTDVYATCQGSVMGSAAVTVNPVPDAILSGSQTVCNGFPATLSVQLSGVAPWNITYTDGTNATVVNNIMNSPYVFQLTPASAVTYQMSQVFATCAGTLSGDAALGLSNPPLAFIGGNNNICLGESTALTIGLSGFAPWNIAYTDGVQTTSVTGITSSPYIINITPTQTLAYTLQSISSNCVGSVSGQASVLVKPVPGASFSSALVPVCFGNSAQVSVQLTGVQPWDLTYTDGVTPVTIQGITSSPYVFTVVNPVVNETFTITDVFSTCQGNIGQGVVVVQPENPPVATLSGDHTVCITQQAPLQVGFTGTGPWDLVYTDGINNYSVSGLTANPSIIQAPTGATQLNYMLVSVDGACSGNVTGTSVVDIVNKPVATLSAPAGICQSIGGMLSVQLSGTGPWNVSYTDGTNIWSESNIPANPYSWFVNPTSDIVYQLTHVSDTYCAGNVISVPVSVPVSTQPQATFTGTQTICAGEIADLQIQVTGQAPWDVVYTDGTTLKILSGLQGDTLIQVTPQSDRTYTLTHVSTRGCSGVLLDSAEVTVLPAATPAMAGASQAICANTFLLSGNQPLAGTGYWQVIQGGGQISIPDTNITQVTGLTVGTNTFEWKITNGICISTDTISLQVSLPPTSAQAGGTQYVCGSSTLLNANAPVNGMGTWSVVSGMATFSNPNDPNTVVPTLSLGHTVLLWTITQGGCVSSDTLHIYSALSAPVANAGPDQLICAPTTQLQASLPPVGQAHWSALSGTATLVDSLDANTPVSGLTLGSHGFVWVTRNGGCEARDTIFVQVIDAPVADFNFIQFGFDVDFNNQSTGGAAAYQWYFGDGSVSSEQHPHHTYMQAGAYPVMLIVTNVCKSDTFHATVNIGGVSVDASLSLSEFLSIYPNPADAGYVEVRASGFTGKYIRFKLYNLLGAELMQREIESLGRAEFRERIELGTWLSKGTYSVVLETDLGNHIEKLIIR